MRVGGWAHEDGRVAAYSLRAGAGLGAPPGINCDPGSLAGTAGSSAGNPLGALPAATPPEENARGTPLVTYWTDTAPLGAPNDGPVGAPNDAP
jgi:hypothetical protein